MVKKHERLWICGFDFSRNPRGLRNNCWTLLSGGYVVSNDRRMVLRNLHVAYRGNDFLWDLCRCEERIAMKDSGYDLLAAILLMVLFVGAALILASKFMN